MARDRTRNAYFTIGIPLNSETYAALKADAEETGVSIPLLLGIRIADWYNLARRGAVLSFQTGQPAESASQQKPSSGANPMQARALAAAAAWGREDD